VRITETEVRCRLTPPATGDNNSGDTSPGCGYLRLIVTQRPARPGSNFRRGKGSLVLQFRAVNFIQDAARKMLPCLDRQISTGKSMRPRILIENRRDVRSRRGNPEGPCGYSEIISPFALDQERRVPCNATRTLGGRKSAPEQPELDIEGPESIAIKSRLIALL